MQKDNDNELLYFIHANDEIAFRYLFLKYENSIRYVIHKFQHKKDRRCCEDDLLQIARIKLLQAVDFYQEEIGTTFSFFFFDILEHTLIDYYRTRYSRKGSNDFMAISLDSFVYEQEELYMVNGQSELYYEVCERIEKGKRHLKPIERSIIDLRMEGYTYTQISNNLQIKKKKIDYTLQKMRKHD